jgi:hypothetical protein
MLQTKFSVEETQLQFLGNYKEYGFKDKSSMIRTAIDQLKKKFELDRLIESADLYSETYTKNNELKELAETAINGWPE